MQELERQTWADLNLLRNPASKRDTFLRQRKYLEQKLNREPNLSEQERQQLLKMFNLDDALFRFSDNDFGLVLIIVIFE